MQVIRNERVIFFDVDDTLIIWEPPGVRWGSEYSRYVDITDPYDGKTFTLRVHEPHLKLLENHLARGSQIIVWSQGGYAWAEAVVKALGLARDDYKSDLIIMSKPFEYVDDLPIEQWLKNRLYIPSDSAWGRSEEEKCD